jgi:hypothetical protein
MFSSSIFENGHELYTLDSEWFKCFWYAYNLLRYVFLIQIFLSPKVVPAVISVFSQKLLSKHLYFFTCSVLTESRLVCNKYFENLLFLVNVERPNSHVWVISLNLRAQYICTKEDSFTDSSRIDGQGSILRDCVHLRIMRTNPQIA